MPELPPQQVNAVANQVLKTWWFWLFLVVLVWSGMLLVEKTTHYQEDKLRAKLELEASNQLAQSMIGISNSIRQQMTLNVANQMKTDLASISNQIAAALAEPEIQAAIQSAATRQATLLMSKSITPALSNFQAKLAQAQARLDSLTNARPAAISEAPKKEPVKIATPPAVSDIPSTLVFDSQSITRQGANYVVTVFFRKVGDKPLGLLHFAAGAYNALPARILGIDDVDPAPDIQTTLDPSGLEAAVSFTPPNGVNPAIKILLSGPSILQVASDAMPEPITVSAVVNPAGAPQTSR